MLLAKPKLCIKVEVVRFNGCRNNYGFQNFYGAPLAQPLPMLDLKVDFTAYCANRKMCTKSEVASSIITEIREGPKFYYCIVVKEDRRRKTLISNPHAQGTSEDPDGCCGG